MPHAFTRISTSSGAGIGSGISLSSRCLYSDSKSAFMVFPSYVRSVVTGLLREILPAAACGNK
jgi:hypothetical protein